MYKFIVNTFSALCLVAFINVPVSLANAKPVHTIAKANPEKTTSGKKKPGKTKAKGKKTSKANGLTGKGGGKTLGLGGKKLKKKAAADYENYSSEDASSAEGTSDSHSSSTDFLAGSFVMGFVVFFLAAYVFFVACIWKIFTKAGEQGWQAIVPILNLVITARIARMPTWSLVLAFIPYLNGAFAIWATFAMAKAFGKSAAYGAGLLFLPIFFYPHLAFSDATYQTGNDFNPDPSDSYKMAG